jgi:xanthine dehydrogenase accessory factor
VEEIEQVYATALEAIRRGEGAAVATVLEAHGSTPREAGAKMLVYADGRTVGTVGGGPLEAQVIQEAQAALSAGVSREFEYRATREQVSAPDACGGQMRLFIEVLQPHTTLLIIGAGHIGQAVAKLGSFLGYRLIVLDERADMVTAGRFPARCRLLTGSLDEQLRTLSLTEQTSVVIVTPHNSPDEKALAVLAKHPVAYVGLLGSQRRTRATFERARVLGVSDEFLKQVHTPIGLDIGAETPHEIAVCIIAQIVAVQRDQA